jgi:hypothetical protein
LNYQNLVIPTIHHVIPKAFRLLSGKKGLKGIFGKKPKPTLKAQTTTDPTTKPDQSIDDENVAAKDSPKDVSRALDRPAEIPSSIPAADSKTGGAEQSEERRREMAREVNYVYQTFSANSGSKRQVPFRIKISQWWPREPKGHVIKTRLSELSYGKKTPSGFHWGASVFNWYWYNRIPDVENFVSKATSSQLAGYMRAHGELYAKDLLAIADEEPDPELLPPYDLRQLILESDEREPEERGQSNPLWDRKGKGKEALSDSEVCLSFTYIKQSPEFMRSPA